MNSLELFAGCGGLALGLEKAGFGHLALVERDRHACDTLRLNADGIARWTLEDIQESDVRTMSYHQLKGRVDLLAAGVPCQPFSLAGLHLGHHDERNMFPWLLDAVRETRPAVILVENVRGLARQSFRPYLDYILDQLRLPEIVAREREPWVEHHRRLRWELAAMPTEGMRYVVDWQPVDAADYGVPQRRHRILIQAVSARWNAEPGWPEPTHSRWMLEEAKHDGSYWAEHGIEPTTAESSEKTVAPPGLDGPTQRWRTVRDALRKIPDPYGSPTDLPNHVPIPGARRYQGHDGSRLDEPAKTLKAGVHGVPGGESIVIADDGTHRYLTVREAAILQDFNPRYRFAGSRTECMRQVGNAVPVGLAHAAGAAVATVLRGKQSVEWDAIATVG